jgi:hypothetical protein
LPLDLMFLMFLMFCWFVFYQLCITKTDDMCVALSGFVQWIVIMCNNDNYYKSIFM